MEMGVLKSTSHRIEGDIPVDLTPSWGDSFLFISNDQRKHTHGLHKYPAKFFPELPRWVIEKYSERGDWVLDPFAGSGTVNVEAMLLGRPSVALDIDPFARFLIKAKTTKIDPALLTKTAEAVRARLEQFSGKAQTLPDFPYAEHWFAPHVLNELAYIKHVIQTVQVSVAARNFMLAVFSSIIRAVSNADNHCTRTVVRKRLNKPIGGGEPRYGYSLRGWKIKSSKSPHFPMTYLK